LDQEALLGQAYELDTYQTHTQGVTVEAMIYVEVDVKPVYALAEAAWVAQQASAMDPRLQGLIAFAPVEDGELVRVYLDELAKIGPLVKGVRRIVQGEADPAFCAQPDFIRGVQILAEYGLSFELCLRHFQLPAAVELAKHCPQTSFMLDHIGKPAIAERQLEPWRTQIRALAAYPNVTCKVSGLVTEADPHQWTPDNLAPYILHVLEAFGEDRVVFGGDWPVILLASNYKRWVETLDTLTAHLSAGAKRKLWVENARRFYRLPLH
jgi:L-fuconolactonase